MKLYLSDYKLSANISNPESYTFSDNCVDTPPSDCYVVRKHAFLAGFWNWTTESSSGWLPPDSDF